MESRTLVNENLHASLLGLGCMRMPVDSDGELIEQEAIDLIRHAIDSGITYIDTAYGYHGGKSETVVGKALKDGYREKVLVTTKLPGWKCETEEDMERIFSEQLARLQLDSVDFYLLHSLYDDLWQKLLKLNVHQFLDRLLEEGLVRYVGFSFHDEFPVFKEILESRHWDVCQIQYNLLDEHYQAGQAGIDLAKDKGVDVIVMEPLRGGALATKVPDDIKELWAKSPRDYSPVEWAFRFVQKEEQVKVILSGMSDKAQVDDNVRIFRSLSDTPLTESDMATIHQVQERYKEKIKVHCTACEYCLPCPQQVAIPRIFSLYNNVYLFDDLDRSQEGYEKLIEEAIDQSKCIACGICQTKCPQHLEIIEGLIDADQVLRL